MYAERRLTLNTVLWSKYFMFKNVVWFPYISSCGLRLDEHPFNASIVPNDNVCLLLTTRLQRPVNVTSLRKDVNVLSLPCRYEFFGAISYIMQLFSLNHILNSRCLKIYQALAVDCWFSWVWNEKFGFGSMWSSCHRWWTGSEWRRWSERVILCVLMAL